MGDDRRKELGRRGEEIAAEHFERLGYEVLARNYRTRLGEIDLVAVEGDTLVFAEVKTCRAGRGRPWDNLHGGKRAQVRRLSSIWLNDQTERPYCRDLRFDAVGIVVDGAGALVSLDHLEGAF